MRNYRREDQLSEVIVRELSDLIRTRMKDPRVGFASITDVELSHDLRHAKVFVSVMGSQEEQHETMRALGHGTGFLRRELAQRMNIRYVPDLVFRLDESIARGTRVLNLLNQVKAEDTAKPPASTPADPGEV